MSELTRKLTLSVAEGTRGIQTNNVYSVQRAITTKEDFAMSVIYDHVAGIFQNNERSIKNFIKADCVIMDCDNDHSDNPADWLTVEKLKARMQGVPFIVVYSRNHNKEKNGKSARPRFHVYFWLSETFTNADEIKKIKHSIRAIVPEFDDNALDAARFIYGVEAPIIESEEEGNTCIDEYLLIQGITTPEADIFSDSTEGTDSTDALREDTGSEIINAGSRNNTLFSFALHLLTRTDYTKEKSRKLFDERCAKCNPPLSIAECGKIWESACKAEKDIKSRYTQKTRYINPALISRLVEGMNITARYNVITKEAEIGDLPQSPYLPPKYYTLGGTAKAEANGQNLPHLLYSTLKNDNYAFTDGMLRECLNSVITSNVYNPIAEIINATKWDGEDRIAKLCEVLHFHDNPRGGLYCVCLRKWLHQAVAFVFNDDSDLDGAFAFVLQGPQGAGKTSFFRRLAMRDEWFVEGETINTADKDTIMKVTSAWICEIGELDETLKREQASLKSFLTRRIDIYRPPYGTKVIKVCRRTVFCATVNPQEVHRDITGSRRFCYVHVDDIDKHFIFETMSPEWVAQLWRQVYEELYLAHGRRGYFLTVEDIKELAENNATFSVKLPLEQELEDLLDLESTPEIEGEYTPNTKVWKWYTATQVLLHLKGLGRRYNSKILGDTLMRICEHHSIAEKRRVHGHTEYYLPELPTID